MLTRRTIAASDVPTLRTPAEMQPPTSRRGQAFHTPVAAWFRSRVNSTMIFFHLSHQQDLPDAALFRRCLSLARFTEWQGLANRDYQPAISHCFRHELERFPIEFREYRRHLHSRILRGVLRRPDN